LAPALATVLAQHPVDLISLAQHGINEGDDLHARTTSATAALYTQLAPGLTDTSVQAMFAQTPLFFLTLWMAACHLMMSAAAQPADPSTSIVVALAGNGTDVGLRLAGKPGQWFTALAKAPEGPRIDPASEALPAPLTGDSGVIDVAGFGAQALAFAPEPAQAFTAWLPAQWQAEQARVYAGRHPAFTQLHCGLDAERVASEGIAPLAAIAMIGADGLAGLLGRGLYTAPIELFAQAIA
jgi:hypothetical protein